MLEELQNIRTAAQLLSVREPALAEPLLGACATIWEQIYERSDRPSDLEASARRLAKRLSTANGTVEETVTAMDEKEATAVARAIVDFAGEFNAKNGALV